MRRRFVLPRPDLIIILILALLPALFFWRLIAPNPADRMNIAAGDFTGQYYPLRLYAARELSAGRLPLWNPYLYAGQPALADIQSGALYPPQIAQVFLLDWLGFGFPVWALELQAIAHFSWAAVGAYLLGLRLARRASRSLRNARFAGVVASLVFTYSGYLTGFPVQQLTILEVSAWAPWVLLALDGVTSGLGIRRSILAGLILGLSLLPGHPQTSLYVVYLGVAFYYFQVLFKLPADDRPSARSRDLRTAAGHPLSAIRYPSHGTLEGLPVTRPTGPWKGYPLPVPRDPGRATCYLLLALLFAFALAGAQLLPTLEMIARSPRADLSYEAVSFGLPLHELVSILYPGYFGGSPEYLGILPLVLIGVALAIGRPGRSIAFWALAGLVGLLLALGGNTFLYPLFYLLAPGFGAVRHQERAFLIYALSGAILSGYGALALAAPLDRLQRARLWRFERGLRVIFWVALALTALFFYGWVGSEHRDLFAGVLRHHIFALIILAGGLILLALRPARALRRPWGMALAAGWIAFNLFSVNWRFNLEQPGPAGPFPATELTEFLKARTAVPGGPPGRIASAGLLPGGPSAAAVYGLHDITGNTPLYLASLEAFEQGVPEWRRWQLLNVSYVLSQRDLESPGLTPVFATGADGEGQVRVYAMGDPFPRAWVVHSVEVIPDQAAALARISADEFDLRRSAVVDRPLEQPLPGPRDGSTARVVAFGPQGVQVEVDAEDDGLLVLSEVYYPGWRASLDGQPAQLVRANFLLRGVPVPKGQHLVRLWYAPLSVRIGTWMSGVALALVVGVGAWHAKQSSAILPPDIFRAIMD